MRFQRNRLQHTDREVFIGDSGSMETACRKLKVNIITLHSSVNYGSVLQTYATMHIFERLGCTVEFTDYTRKNATDQAYADRMQKNVILKTLKRITLGRMDKAINAMALCRVRKRAKPMRDFLQRYIPMTAVKYSSYEELKENPPQADIYCTGSDQVWNSEWNGGIEYPYFLEYAPSGKKRIAYAASIGQESLTAAEEQIVGPLLQRYAFISMREASGVEILNKMGIEAEWVIDPTLMLPRTEWMKIAEPIPQPRKKYLLAYVLNWTDAIEKAAHKLARENGWEIVRICKSKSSFFTGGTRMVIPTHVGQLISYFDQAECVITDSFHATAFSINFHKDFLVIPPKRFATRLESILKLTGTEDHMPSTTNATLCKGTDWARIDRILADEREKAYGFLRKALK